MFIFYFSNNLVYWLYSLKQWTISIEVPRQINRLTEEDLGIHISEGCYRSLKWTGIACSFLVASLLAFFRYKLCIDLLENVPSPQKAIN